MITFNTTYQQTKRLVDTVEGIYQNTLTIAQSVAEHNIYDTRYNCMVENSRGKSNRTMYLYGKNVRPFAYVRGHENFQLWSCQYRGLVSQSNYHNASNNKPEKMVLGRQ